MLTILILNNIDMFCCRFGTFSCIRNLQLNSNVLLLRALQHADILKVGHFLLLSKKGIFKILMLPISVWLSSFFLRNDMKTE